MLLHYELPQHTLDFLNTLSPPPPVEVPALPKHQRKGKKKKQMNSTKLYYSRKDIGPRP